MQKIVITGSNGLLGQTAVNLLLNHPDQYEVIGLSKGLNRSGRNDFDYINVDLTDADKTKKVLLALQPDCIVNTAAMTNVDACENNQEACERLNVEAVQTLVDICQELDAHLIQLSTDFIFDGKQGFYKETDMPNPLSFYGKTKLKSEEILTGSSIKYTILRTILVYGKVAEMTKNNIVLWVKESLENDREITIVNDQYRMPTYVVELANACKLVIDKRATGVFNISSNTLLSIYEIAEQIADVFELDKALIKPISTGTLNQTAPRPVKTGFDLSKTIRELGFTPKSFLEDLQEFKGNLT